MGTLGPWSAQESPVEHRVQVILVRRHGSSADIMNPYEFSGKSAQLSQCLLLYVLAEHCQAACMTRPDVFVFPTYLELCEI